MTSEGGEKQLTILLIEEDDETRPLLKRYLQSDGYQVVAALDEEDALERVSERGVAADLILVDLVGKGMEGALNVGRRVRERAKYDGQMPLVVMAEKYGEELEGRDVNVSGNVWITYPEDGQQLKSLLARLTTKLRK
jgi:DNA-binding response OmpR family regulator